MCRARGIFGEHTHNTARAEIGQIDGGAAEHIEGGERIAHIHRYDVREEIFICGHIRPVMKAQPEYHDLIEYIVYVRSAVQSKFIHA